MRHLLHEPRLRRGELHLQGRVVERLDPDLVAHRGTARLARVVFGRADDPEELIRVVRREIRRDRALPGPFEVVRRDGVAVRPASVVPQVEGHGLAVL